MLTKVQNRRSLVTQHTFLTHGQYRTSNELRKRSVFVSGSDLRPIWLRHKLENFKSRLSAREAKVANEGIVLSDEQIAAPERKHENEVNCGEIETAHPGYLGHKMPSTQAI